MTMVKCVLLLPKLPMLKYHRNVLYNTHMCLNIFAKKLYQIQIYLQYSISQKYIYLSSLFYVIVDVIITNKMFYYNYYNVHFFFWFYIVSTCSEQNIQTFKLQGTVARETQKVVPNNNEYKQRKFLGTIQHCRLEYNRVGQDGMGWDGMGWDGMGWDGMGWVGWDDGIIWDRIRYSKPSHYHDRLLY